MKFYHGTSRNNWEKIKKERVLWGIPTVFCHMGYIRRYTYLTPYTEVAQKYGEVSLEIEYEPVGVDGRGIDNYGFDPPPGQTCWQFSVFIPIPIKNMKIYKDNKNGRKK